MIHDFTNFGDRSRLALNYRSKPERKNRIFCLTDAVDTMQRFCSFEPEVERAALELYAAQLAKQCGWQSEVVKLHLCAIARHAGLEVLS